MRRHADSRGGLHTREKDLRFVPLEGVHPRSARLPDALLPGAAGALHEHQAAPRGAAVGGHRRAAGGLQPGLFQRRCALFLQNLRRGQHRLRLRAGAVRPCLLRQARDFVRQRGHGAHFLLAGRLSRRADDGEGEQAGGSGRDRCRRLRNCVSPAAAARRPWRHTQAHRPDIPA